MQKKCPGVDLGLGQRKWPKNVSKTFLGIYKLCFFIVCFRKVFKTLFPTTPFPPGHVLEDARAGSVFHHLTRLFRCNAFVLTGNCRGESSTLCVVLRRLTPWPFRHAMTAGNTSTCYAHTLTVVRHTLFLIVGYCSRQLTSYWNFPALLILLSGARLM